MIQGSSQTSRNPKAPNKTAGPNGGDNEQRRTKNINSTGFAHDEVVDVIHGTQEGSGDTQDVEGVGESRNSRRQGRRRRRSTRRRGHSRRRGPSRRRKRRPRSRGRGLDKARKSRRRGRRRRRSSSRRRHSGRPSPHGAACNRGRDDGAWKACQATGIMELGAKVATDMVTWVWGP